MKEAEFFNPSIKLSERVAAAFLPQGPLSKATPGFCAREGQLSFAQAVVETIERQDTLVAEAGTGTGKTFAYLTPAILAGLNVVISTAGKPLQDQLFAKDLPALLKALKNPAQIALLKGRANYVCPIRLAQTRDENRLPERDSYIKLHKIERWAAVTQTGDRSELPEVPENDLLWSFVTSTRENCLGRERCPKYEECFVRQAREKAMKSQIVVVNHHLFLSSMALKNTSDGIDGMFPKADLTIIDEAHQLPGIATDFFGTSFSTREVEDIALDARALGRSKVPDGAKWDDIYSAILKAVSEVRQAVEALKLVEGDRQAVAKIEGVVSLKEPLQKLYEAFNVLGEAMFANAGRDDDLDTLAQYRDEVAQEIQLWIQVFKAGGASSAYSSGDRVRWLEVLRQSVKFNNTPLSFADEFAAMREKEGGAWVFTSATLSTAGDFSHFKDEMGITDGRAASWPSPFNYWEQGLFYLPRMPAPANNTREHTQNVVQQAWPLIMAAGGRTFLLCTSLAAVSRAAEILEAKLEANGRPYPLLVQGMGTRSYLIDQFRKLGNAILVGSMSFWEGVDVKGDALSLVVIDKIPFAPPDDPVSAARCESIRSHGGDPFMSFTLPEAVISLKQGAGRLIRSEKDRGMFMLCDTRTWEKRYGREVVMKSLPGFYRTRREDIALRFFADEEGFKELLYE